MRCHNHPFDVWTQDDYFGLAAFFSNVSRKQINNSRRDRLDLHEINGDEMIYLAGHAELVQPRTGALCSRNIRGGGRQDRRRDRSTMQSSGSRSGSPRTTASSALTSQTGCGFTFWAEESSSPSMISATRTRRRILPSSMR